MVCKWWADTQIQWQKANKFANIFAFFTVIL